MMSRGKDGCDRLEGPAPADVDLDPKPVVVDRRTDDPATFLGLLCMLALTVIGACAMVWLVAVASDPTGYAGFAFFAAFSVLEAWLARNANQDRTGDRFRVDADGASLLRGDRVLRTIPFDGETGLHVNVSLDRDGGLEGVMYSIERGWRTFLLGSGAIAAGDLEHMWPVLRAAAWKHRVAVGATTPCCTSTSWSSASSRSPAWPWEGTG